MGILGTNCPFGAFAPGSLLTRYRPDDAPTPTSDYLDASEVKVKSKKKKTKSTRRKAADDDDFLLGGPRRQAAAHDSSMDVDSGAAVYTKKKRAIDDAYVDDDDLQATLAQQRRDALEKRKKVRPEDIAKQLRDEAADSPEPENGADGAGNGLLIDEITYRGCSTQVHGG